jgi:hypothetical protein
MIAPEDGGDGTLSQALSLIDNVLALAQENNQFLLEAEVQRVRGDGKRCGWCSYATRRTRCSTLTWSSGRRIPRAAISSVQPGPGPETELNW